MTLKNLNTYTCQFCQKSYKSDGSRKPKSFRKNGSVYQYYDSKLFCSKKCCQDYSHEKIRQLYKNNPEILRKSVLKRKQTLKNNPEIMKKVAKKIKQTNKKKRVSKL